MRYLIDGYNLLYALYALPKQLAYRQFEQKRNEMLDYLVHYLGPTANTVTVVFDHRRVSHPNGHTDNHRGLTLVMVRNADAYIIQSVQRESTPHQLAVVSNDNQVREAARRRNCLLYSCAAYIDHLNRLQAFSDQHDPTQLTATSTATAPEKPTTASAEDDELLALWGSDIHHQQARLTQPLKRKRPG